MKRTYLSIILGLLYSLFLSAESWTGTGDAMDPYQISSVEQLQELADRVNEGTSYEDQYFLLTEDLDMSDTTADCQDWIAIGTLKRPFAGFFDGNGKEIRNIQFAGGNYLGLFGCLSHRAEVWDLTIFNPNGWGNADMGVICGLNEGTIRACKVVRGGISDPKIIGGIAGINYGIIDGCSNDCYVSSKIATGGIAGFNYGVITNCTNTRGFDGLMGTGGIVGYNGGFSHEPCNHDTHKRGFVSHCANEGTVLGDSYTGGICGRNDGLLVNCENEGLVKSLVYSGGIAGVNGSVVNTAGTIYNSFNTGTIYAEDSIAGAICGLNTGNGVVDNVFNEGKILSSDTTSTLLVARDEGFSDHLYELFRDFTYEPLPIDTLSTDSTAVDSLVSVENLAAKRYYQSLDSIVTLMNTWVDTVHFSPLYTWSATDSVISFGVYEVTTDVAEEINESMKEDTQTEVAYGGVWLEKNHSIYTVKGELIYLNRGGKLRYVPLRIGLYVVGDKNGFKKVMVARE